MYKISTFHVRGYRQNSPENPRNPRVRGVEEFDSRDSPMPVDLRSSTPGHPTTDDRWKRPGMDPQIWCGCRVLSSITSSNRSLFQTMPPEMYFLSLTLLTTNRDKRGGEGVKGGELAKLSTITPSEVPMSSFTTFCCQLFLLEHVACRDTSFRVENDTHKHRERYQSLLKMKN